VTAPDAPLPAPTQQDYFEAAQCWCDPTTSALVMEPKLALVIAKALARARHAGEVAERERIVKLAEQWKSSYGDEDFIAAIRSLAPDTEAEK